MSVEEDKKSFLDDSDSGESDQEAADVMANEYAPVSSFKRDESPLSYFICDDEDDEDDVDYSKIPSCKERGEPVCLLFIGMAGSGKSTLMHRLAAHLRSTARKAVRESPEAAALAPEARKKAEKAAAAAALYCINLDPAVQECPFGPNIDIRDTVKYKEVMKHYGLGPNGAIMTSLNLFAAKFNQVISLIEKRLPHKEDGEQEQKKGVPLQHVLVDTPGQIEAFTWSASGQIFTEALANTLPTAVVYVVDVPRSVANPSTFMANMLYACSILYRTKLPLVVALTKTDIVSGDIVLQWMRDLDVFEEALAADPSYAHDFAHSLGLVLQEFYANLHAAGVSAVTGDGVDNLLKAVDNASREYYGVYVKDLQEKKRKKEQEALEGQRENIERLRKDIIADGHGGDPIN